MRREHWYLFPLISTLLLLFSAPSYGQAWSGILSTGRAIDWGHAGLQATFPDGETTPNPWSPPTRTLCTTLNPLGSGKDDVPQIIAAVSGCAAGTYVLMNPGTWTVASYMRLSPGYTSGHNYVTIRGSGPMQTIVNMTGASANINLGAVACCSSALLTSDASNFTVGSTSIKITTSSPPSKGQLVYLTQCDTGTSWNGGGCTGKAVDNGGLFVCAFDSACQSSGGETPSYLDQQQQFIVTSVANNQNGTYTIGFTNGLYMNNWSFAQGAQLNWPSASYTAIGMGLEDMTVVFQSGASQSVSISGAYDSWIKGLRLIGAAQTGAINISASKNNLVANNYLYTENSTPSSAIQIGIDHGSHADDLILNNIVTGGVPFEGEGFDTGNVLAYNFNRDAQTTYYQLEIEHHAESSLLLHEGNQQDGAQDDDTWGTHAFNSWFRNYYSGWDSPYTASTSNPRAIQIDNFARFENVIGNAFGSSAISGGYQSTGASGYIYALSSTDTLATTSLLRWGNCDTFTGTCRFQNSEVPASLGGNAAPFVNPVPGSQSLPASFFMNGAVAQPNGGTGLSWWKVCTNWTTFPTTCGSSQTPPFPTSGPDVSSGPYVNGHAYDNPAAVAFRNLPIDTSYQRSYSITGSSWSGGIETLTVSGLPNVLHLMGPFQISGGACSSGTGEFYMTNSTSATVSYASASNPGSCSGGTMNWPNVRQFDERVYQSDSSGNPPPQAPTGLQTNVH
jgi:hypothetical protein